MPSDSRRDYSTPNLHPDLLSQRGRSGITKLTVDIPSSYRPPPENITTRYPSQWRTPEFYLYYVAFAAVVPFMVYIPIRLSYTTHPNYLRYQHRLSPGWLFGQKVDNSDHQYRTFRDNVPVLFALLAVFLSLKQLYVRILAPRLTIRSEANLHLVPFIIAFGILMLLGLHGSSAPKVLAVFLLNYTIAKYTAASKFGPLATWIFNVAVLFAADKYAGFPYASLHPSLNYLDTLDGFYRWHVGFNITMLRLISFNMDYHWACRRIGQTDNGRELEYKERTRTSHSLDIYNVWNYLAYVLYSPLYIGGPIMSFNDFLWQLRRPLNIPLRTTLAYLFRFAICILTMEFILHFMYVVAIKDTKAWQGDNAAELSMIGLWNLIIIWLKLLVPWRFFRLWALLDGIDPPENMVRCVLNNYSAQGFWRAWHRSYNLWIVRYIYIPLGGTKNVVFTTILVFTFVALWHDLSFRLLAWGWLVSLFIIPEILASYVLPASKFGSRWWYRHACAVGAVFNMMMMMGANLVGFVLGTEGVSYMLGQLFSSWEGIRFIVFSCVCLFIGSQVMFEYRAEEIRKGVVRRC
ncbi:hypothetical protein QCA50_010928 [Cerrena zonata]|uniref:Glycerol transporter n=1 Tax=Cerrena zonata TaxID=2478898 RepID=A0AAW0G928_9APHY